ncbi:MAG: protein kinase [Blastocatellia bacterium]|nr:protein kinase [Blastocatellia bacterium]
MKICPQCSNKFEDSVNFCPHDKQVLELDLTYLVGTVLDGQYQIEALLGVGGMGAVYRARHIRLDDLVAIKIIPSHLTSDPDRLRRFVREAQAARLFRHENSVTVYDLRETSDGKLYMVLEHVAGQTLGKLLKQKKYFSPIEAFEVLEPVMKALQAAHQKGVIHRDLKPDNIMVAVAADGKKTVKLLDLGIAKIQSMTDLTSITVPGQILGTPYYMSPEQWDGETDIDGRADIYSLGVLFYELIVGKRPFEGRSVESLASQHGFVVPPLLLDKVHGVTAEFSQVIAKALEKDRRNRQKNMAEFHESLRAALYNNRSESLATLVEEENQSTKILTAETPRTQAAEKTENQVAPATLVVDNRAEVTDTSQHPDTKIMPPPSPPTPVRTAEGNGWKVLLFGLILVGLGSGSWWGLTRYVFPSVPVATKPNGPVKPEPPPLVEKQERMRGWLEVQGKNGKTQQVADTPKLTSGSQLRIHLESPTPCYVYLVGRGKTNIPTTFLTTHPIPDSGLKDNLLKAGKSWFFPAQNWLVLDDGPGPEVYQVVVSSQPITGLPFLDQPSFKPLSSEEQAAFRKFLETVPKATIEARTDQFLPGIPNNLTPFWSILLAKETATIITDSNALRNSTFSFEITIERPSSSQP